MSGLNGSVLLRVILGPLLACLHVFAAYVLIHGHLSPGGGFQAGALVGAALILRQLAGGGGADLGPRGALVLILAGLGLYAGMGAAAQALGGQFLDYDALPLGGSDRARHYVGILGIEIGVTLAVAGSMVSLFHTLAAPPEGEGP